MDDLELALRRLAAEADLMARVHHAWKTQRVRSTQEDDERHTVQWGRLRTAIVDVMGEIATEADARAILDRVLGEETDA